MFQTLTNNLSKVFDRLRGMGALSEANIKEAMTEIRGILIDSDVALDVVKAFIDEVSKKAMGQDVIKSVTPGQMVVKIIHDELIAVLAPLDGEAELNLNASPPVNIMIAGLQGSGKTTCAAKLALHLKRQKKRVLLVSLDTHRPAAQEQLAMLGQRIEVDSLPIVADQQPLDICQRALEYSKLGIYEIVIYDTAGRLHLDDELINEAKAISRQISPQETILVVDSMIGQDATNVATSFNDALGITGVVLSRIDGDAKGGAALSIRYTTKKPIKFLSTGEKPEDFEKFDAERIAMRILDKGDVVGFVEKASNLMDEEDAKKSVAKFEKGKFDLTDYITQIKMIKKMGGIGGLMGMIPGMSKLKNKMGAADIDEKMLVHQEAIILSMTKKEKRNPKLLNASRRKRIASGSGRPVQEVNNLIKQYTKVSSLMKKASKMDPRSLMRGNFDQLFS